MTWLVAVWGIFGATRTGDIAISPMVPGSPHCKKCKKGAIAFFGTIKLCQENRVGNLPPIKTQHFSPDDYNETSRSPINDFSGRSFESENSQVSQYFVIQDKFIYNNGLSRSHNAQNTVSEGFLLTRVLLRFSHPSEDLHGELSAVTISDDGSLWVGSDEYLTLERLSKIEPGVYGEHDAHAIADFIELPNTEDEIDIEAMDFTDNYLWFVGSHSTKRKKTKGKTVKKDLERLTQIKSEANRYLLARIPVVGGTPFKSCSHPDVPDLTLNAAALQTTPDGNILMDALRDDPHLGPFVAANLPSKDNGLDIEGLAVRGEKIFLGLRGPVLRGWAVLLEIEVTETAPGLLGLKAIGEDGRLYKKHFLDLDGLGVRELCWLGDDLMVLAGPTMELAGATRLFRFKNPLELETDSIFDRDSEGLTHLFDLPFAPDGDKAEGLALFPCLGQSQALLVVYDSPREARQPEPNGVFADVFAIDFTNS